MLEFQGKYTSAKVFTDKIEESCISQIYDFLNNEAFEGLKIRIMPDVHAGKGAVIGFTSNIKDKVIPNVVGVDIGCGVLTIKIKEQEIDFQKLDETIRKHIPSGTGIRNKEHKYTEKLRLNELKCKQNININRALLSCGTLGGGNHYIEIDKSENGELYISIHSGSRHLGKQVAEYYQNLAYKTLSEDGISKKIIVEKLKSEGREREIQKELSKIKPKNINKNLAYLTGQNMRDYIHDMKIVQEYANYNREAIGDTIVQYMDLTKLEQFNTIHNYIDTDNEILRKGAISAQRNEKVAIPISMKDGVIIGIGKGNKEWNCSACHGAGRVLSRSQAKKLISVEEFEDSMKGVWSTSVNESTIDESPFAYKSVEDIVPYIKDTVDIIEILKPIYNYKSS